MFVFVPRAEVLKLIFLFNTNDLLNYFEILNTDISVITILKV